MSEKVRQRFVTLIEDLNTRKGYKEETLYVAQSIADRYFVHLIVRKQLQPCFVTLSLICTLLAAKLCEKIQPSFKRMIDLAHEIWDIKIKL